MEAAKNGTRHFGTMVETMVETTTFWYLEGNHDSRSLLGGASNPPQGLKIGEHVHDDLKWRKRNKGTTRAVKQPLSGKGGFVSKQNPQHAWGLFFLFKKDTCGCFSMDSVRIE